LNSFSFYLLRISTLAALAVIRTTTWVSLSVSLIFLSVDKSWLTGAITSPRNSPWRIFNRFWHSLLSYCLLPVKVTILPSGIYVLFYRIFRLPSPCGYCQSCYRPTRICKGFFLVFTHLLIAQVLGFFFSPITGWLNPPVKRAFGLSIHLRFFLFGLGCSPCW
jgi:hypothetical protein